MKNSLLGLSSHRRIPFPEAHLTIINPTIDEISLIGEDSFHPGLKFLVFSKDQLNIADKTGLENQTDFDIFMSIMCSSERLAFKNDAIMVLTLLFPDYQFKFDLKQGIIFKHNSNEEFDAVINNNNFETFKEILIYIFDLKEDESAKKYNPADARAAKIAEKLKKRKKSKQGSVDSENSSIEIYSTYVSILSVGLQMSINVLMQYTVFQLKEEFARYQMKLAYDMYIQARMAGATDLEEVQNWMDNIHK